MKQRVRLFGCRIKADCQHEGPGPEGLEPSVGISGKTTKNFERLGR